MFELIVCLIDLQVGYWLIHYIYLTRRGKVHCRNAELFMLRVFLFLGCNFANGGRSSLAKAVGFLPKADVKMHIRFKNFIVLTPLD